MKDKLTQDDSVKFSLDIAELTDEIQKLTEGITDPDPLGEPDFSDFSNEEDDEEEDEEDEEDFLDLDEDDEY